MANMEVVLNATDNVTPKVQKASQELKNFKEIASKSTQPSFIDNTASNIAGPSQTQNINDVKSDSRGIPIQTAVEKQSLIADDLHRLVETLPNLIKGITDSNYSQDKAGKNIQNLENKAIGQWAEKIGSYIGQGFTTVGNIQVSGIRRGTRLRQGDVFGAELESINQSESIASSIASGASAVGGALMFVPSGVTQVVGAVLTGVGAAAQGVINWAFGNKKAELEAKQQESESYKNMLTPLEKAYYAFNDDKYNHTWRNYRESILDINSKTLVASRGTGLTLEDFLNNSSSLSSYGITNIDKANELTRQASFVATNTNSDINTVLNLMGLTTRMGNDFDVNKVYSYNKAIGLQDGQFSEFLQGLQGVIETGISNGFIASSEEVSKTMSMFAKLSDNSPLWEGKYGFQRLQTINSGLSNATSLSNSTQMLAYQALNNLVEKNGLQGGAFIEGQDALNTFSLMEAGLNSKSFSAIANSFNNMYGDDTLSKVMAWKQLSGLNYTGAMQLYEMAKNGKDITDEEIEQLKIDYSVDTDSKKMNDALNTIKSDVAEIRTGFATELELLNQYKPFIENKTLSDEVSKVYQTYSPEEATGMKALYAGYMGNIDFDDFINTTYSKEDFSAALEYINMAKKTKGGAIDNWGDLDDFFNTYWKAQKDGIIDAKEINELHKVLVEIKNNIKDIKLVEAS